MLRTDVRVHGFRVTPSPASCAWRWWRPSLAASGLLEALTQHLPSGRRRSASSRRRRRTSKTEQGWLFEHPYSNWGIWQRVFNKRRALHWACSICAERRAVLGENNWQFGRFSSSFFFFLGEVCRPLIFDFLYQQCRERGGPPIKKSDGCVLLSDAWTAVKSVSEEASQRWDKDLLLSGGVSLNSGRERECEGGESVGSNRRTEQLHQELSTQHHYHHHHRSHLAVKVINLPQGWSHQLSHPSEFKELDLFCRRFPSLYISLSTSWIYRWCDVHS